MMAMVRQLEAKLTPAERHAREMAFEQLRQFIRNASKGHGLPEVTRSFPNRPVRGIRIDLEVLKGRAAVPVTKIR
jgi:hypothetical protein